MILFYLLLLFQPEIIEIRVSFSTDNIRRTAENPDFGSYPCTVNDRIAAAQFFEMYPVSTVRVATFLIIVNVNTKPGFFAFRFNGCQFFRDDSQTVIASADYGDAVALFSTNEGDIGVGVSHDNDSGTFTGIGKTGFDIGRCREYRCRQFL